MHTISKIIIVFALFILSSCSTEDTTPQNPSRFLNPADKEAVEKFITSVTQRSAARLEGEALADYYNDLAVVADLQKNYADAITYHMQALDLRKDLGVETDIAKTYNNLAIIYHATGREAEAAELYTQAIAIFNQQDQTEYENYTLKNYSLIKTKSGRVAGDPPSDPPIRFIEGDI